MASSLVTLKERLSEVNALHAAASIMDWDQQTYMPRGGAEARAAHSSILSRMAHELFTDQNTGRLLESAAGDISSEDEAAMLRVVKRDFDLATKLPAKLVEEKSRLASEGHEIWVKARANNDFESFAPCLEKLLEIVRQEAEYLGYKDHIYDALLDQYEEGATAQDCKQMFDAIREPLVSLIKEIQEKGRSIDDGALYGEWDQSKQRQFTESLVQAIGFDMSRGRQDTAPHPFCTGWSVDDVRLTTRYKPYIGAAIFGSLHEAGHGMYEQGSPRAWDRTPLAGGVSLGIHESQSRLWENIVGRSKPFWACYLAKLQELFPQLTSFDVESWYRAINKVQPSLIRVEADEVTYNLHIMVRFEVECALLTNVLKVRDLPDYWNAKYKEYLGVEPQTNSEGCLQDVHWSMGSVGYFPTYSMGNLLSYQIWERLRKDVGDADALIARGDFKPILGWLTDNIYSKGRKYIPRALVQQVTGKPMSAEDYLAGINAKYRQIYQIK